MALTQLEIGLVLLGLLILFIGPHLCQCAPSEDKNEKEKLINT